VLSTAFVQRGKTERLKEWYREVAERESEVLETLDNEGVRQEIAFIVPTEYGDMLAVFAEVEDLDRAREAFAASSFEIDRQHRALNGGSDGWRGGGADARVSDVRLSDQAKVGPGGAPAALAVRRGQ
jgi:hypothetical protein